MHDDTGQRKDTGWSNSSGKSGRPLLQAASVKGSKPHDEGSVQREGSHPWKDDSDSRSDHEKGGKSAGPKGTKPGNQAERGFDSGPGASYSLNAKGKSGKGLPTTSLGAKGFKGNKYSDNGSAFGGGGKGKKGGGLSYDAPVLDDGKGSKGREYIVDGPAFGGSGKGKKGDEYLDDSPLFGGGGKGKKGEGYHDHDDDSSSFGGGGKGTKGDGYHDGSPPFGSGGKGKKGKEYHDHDDDSSSFGGGGKGTKGDGYHHGSPPFGGGGKGKKGEGYHDHDDDSSSFGGGGKGTKGDGYHHDSPPFGGGGKGKKGEEYHDNDSSAFGGGGKGKKRDGGPAFDVGKGSKGKGHSDGSPAIGGDGKGAKGRWPSGDSASPFLSWSTNPVPPTACSRFPHSTAPGAPKGNPVVDAAFGGKGMKGQRYPDDTMLGYRGPNAPSDTQVERRPSYGSSTGSDAYTDSTIGKGCSRSSADASSRGLSSARSQRSEGADSFAGTNYGWASYKGSHRYGGEPLPWPDVVAPAQQYHKGDVSGKTAGKGGKPAPGGGLPGKGCGAPDKGGKPHFREGRGTDDHAADDDTEPALKPGVSRYANKNRGVSESCRPRTLGKPENGRWDFEQLGDITRDLRLVPEAQMFDAFCEALRAEQESSPPDGINTAAAIEKLDRYHTVVYLKQQVTKQKSREALVLLARIMKYSSDRYVEVEFIADQEQRLCSKNPEVEKCIEGIPAEVRQERVYYTYADPQYNVDNHDDFFVDVFETLPKKSYKANVDSEIHEMGWLLDTQFHLLREDFLVPLRNALLQRRGIPVKDVWLDEGVTIEGIGCSMQYGVTYNIRVLFKKWAPDRLRNGSLICLSADNFGREHLLWGCVTGTKTLLQNRDGAGEIVFFLRFYTEVTSAIIGNKYDMIESRIFFEGYVHVLHNLHKKDIADVPFEGVLLGKKESLQNIEFPAYLRDRPLVVNALLCTGADKEDITWNLREDFPPDHETELDPSQLFSVKSALGREVAIVQGPPGTGKTFVGTKVIQVLLDTLWGRDRDKGETDGEGAEDDPPPLLLLCHTNHALDSVLEHLVMPDKNNGDKVIENRVIRVGGASKSEIVKPYSLNHDNVRMPPVLAAIRRQLFTLHKEIEERSDHLSEQKLTQSLELDTGALPANARRYFAEKLRMFRYRRAEVDNERARLLDICEGSAGFSEEARAASKELQNLNREAEALEERCRNIYISWLRGFENEVSGVEDADNEAGNVGVRMGDEGDEDVEDLEMEMYDELDADERRRHFDAWTRPVRSKHGRILKERCVQYEKVAVEKQEREVEFNTRRLAKARLVGATTTGCAKYTKMFEGLKPEVIIVEEAAEVLEAHVISVLTQNCRHLILIGDHKQLQPKVNTYQMQRANLAVSLMERLCNCGYEPAVLLTQRRMRQSICDLTAQFYNQPIRTHPKIDEYPAYIDGLTHPVFFLEHTKPETKDDGSPFNAFEAEFSVRLANYLIKQGYTAKDICILTAYKGQLMAVKERARSKFDTADIKIVCVDNYQGEEVDIVILSLVRSGSDNIGFLQQENRLIVALSRARKGMYVIGNIRFLADCNKEGWGRVVCTYGAVVRRPELLGEMVPADSSLSLSPSLLFQCCARP
ncbi:Helicase required for RNAi-mediated heterochromatin assembly 1 [Diplonema papillatum]|nr:Helicase required for RNAi-mediated heterochromatin assembly 1 [Diplonema papillatum]